MNSPPPNPIPTPHRSRVPDMDPTTTPFDWSDFLDFNLDEDPLLFSSLDPVIPPSPNPPPPNPEDSIIEDSNKDDRVRKRDPRLVCSNFLAGRVPCACPEMDALMEEAAEKEQGGPHKKRVRVARSSKAKCQVPECEADISELKGYHRRHRVCLLCANAKSVVLCGESKRYCQQCGKFHVLSDFDEGKRSCRRKLERHNNRRRRKPVDASGSAEKEPQLDLQGEDVSSDGEDGKGNLSLSTHNTEGDRSQGTSADGNKSNSFSEPDCQIIQGDSAATLTPSGETQVDGAKDDSNYDIPPFFDDKSAYSSVCPTGRISFKLYDWNPAEFPRRLRLQIFQWLASMPVELEGYIRPGCTILTAFISMPVSMWMKLLDDPASYVQDFLSPGRVLSRKGTTRVHLNNMMFHVLKDGTSVIKANLAKQAPKLHYVYPSFFEAGKPMEIIVCGRNIFQPNLRSLVSFGGKYLEHTYSVAFPCDRLSSEASVSFDDQLCRILVPHTEPNIRGPAFIEVENEFGLSNFIPIIIGDEQVCSEMKMIQQKHDISCKNDLHVEPDDSLHDTCQASCSRQSVFSDFLLDVAWLLKQPVAEKLQPAVTSSQIKRLGYLLDFLVRNQSVHILGRILESVRTIVDIIARNKDNGIADVDRRFLQEHVAIARDFLHMTLEKDGGPSCHITKSLQKEGLYSHSTPRSDVQDVRIGAEGNVTSPECSTSTLEDEAVPFLNGEVAVDVVDTKQQWRKPCNPVMTNQFIKSRPSFMIMAAFAICFAVCTVLLHPSPVRKMAVSIRRCLFDDTH